MTLTLAQRREILASMPWVAVSPGPGIFNRRCEGFRSNMPMYAWRASRQPFADVNATLDRWRCHKRARWVFLALDGSIHTYCWWHLYTEGFEGSQEELERYERWRDEYMKTHPVPPDWSDEERDEPLGRS